MFPNGYTATFDLYDGDKVVANASLTIDLNDYANKTAVAVFMDATETTRPFHPKVAETKTLSAENQWTYTFDGLSEGYVWTVEEAEVPEGYEVSYATDGNVTTITNTSKTPTPEPPGNTELTVRKVWNTKKASHPDKVTITLYDGNTAVETVTLNAENNWSYKWTELRDDGNWQVRETNVPRNFAPSYATKDGVVTVTNSDALIQTGQLRWPVYVLGGLGLLLLVLGCSMLLRKKRHG